MTGGWPAALALLAGLFWLAFLTAPVGLILIAAGLAWMWRKSRP